MKMYYGDGTRVPKHIAKMFSKKPDRVYPNNELYDRLKEKAFKLQANRMTVTSFEMSHHLDYMCYKSDTTTITIPGGYLRFCPRAKSVDITRVEVDEQYRGKGIGTVLMKIFMEIMISMMAEHKIFEVPKIILECSGSVGFADRAITTDLSKQINFFQKFGFEVVREKDGYTHLQLTEEGFVKYFQKKNLVEQEN